MSLGSAAIAIVRYYTGFSIQKICQQIMIKSIKNSLVSMIFLKYFLWRGFKGLILDKTGI